MPFWLHFGSIWPQNSVNFGIMFRIRFWTGFRSHFFRFWCNFRPPEHSILMLSCRRRAIFRVFAMPLKISKTIQNLSKMASNICPKSFKNQSKNQPKMTSDFSSWTLQKVPKTNHERKKQKSAHPQTNTHTQTQQLNNRTIQMKRLGGMREAFEWNCGKSWKRSRVFVFKQTNGQAPCHGVMMETKTSSSSEKPEH